MYTYYNYSFAIVLQATLKNMEPHFREKLVVYHNKISADQQHLSGVQFHQPVGY